MALSSSPDVLIAGAGLIGMSLALELEIRGARVAILDTGAAMGQASRAAAGMLAAEDPHNPAALLPLSRLSVGQYPAFLGRLHAISGLQVPFQTYTTLQYMQDGNTITLAENSIDPRQLASAIHRGVCANSIPVHEHLGSLEVEERSEGVTVRAGTGRSWSAHSLVHTAGAWSSSITPLPVAPRKGQMLRVALPFELRTVHRAEDIYIVPRTAGPQAGTALIGATVEEAGFDLRTHPQDLADLRTRASRFLPELADTSATPQMEAWAGLRPATPDLLPVLGPMPGSTRQWIASGHFRNGILLAPGTARLIADALEGKPQSVSLDAFSLMRFYHRKSSRIG